MALPFMRCAGGLASLPDAVSADWAAINVVWPSTNGTNADIAINFNVGANRQVRAIKSAGAGNAVGTLYYRINSGSWVSYITGAGTGAIVTITPGQTLGWKMDDFSGTAGGGLVTVKDIARGDTIDTWSYTNTGSP